VTDVHQVYTAHLQVTEETASAPAFSPLNFNVAVQSCMSTEREF